MHKAKLSNQYISNTSVNGLEHGHFKNLIDSVRLWLIAVIKLAVQTAEGWNMLCGFPTFRFMSRVSDV